MTIELKKIIYLAKLTNKQKLDLAADLIAGVSYDLPDSKMKQAEDLFNIQKSIKKLEL